MTASRVPPRKPPISVPPDAQEAELNAKRDELQRVLDEINQRGEDWRTSLVIRKP
jgi:hypothetical protein